MNPQDKETGVATFAGGCFWCLEAVFQRLDGVKSARSGYMGGEVEDPDYEQVCGGTTGHAEVVQVAFDPARISYGDLLRVFWKIHDPTTLNRQGADVGTQYRSAIFYHSPEQKRQAADSLNELNASGRLPQPAVTEISPAGRFYPAEPYHENYYNRNAGAPYCQFVIAPKLKKIEDDPLYRRV